MLGAYIQQSHPRRGCDWFMGVAGVYITTTFLVVVREEGAVARTMNAPLP